MSLNKEGVIDRMDRVSFNQQAHHGLNLAMDKAWIEFDLDKFV